MCRYLGQDIYQQRLPVTVVSLELLQHPAPVSLLHHLHHLILPVPLGHPVHLLWSHPSIYRAGMKETTLIQAVGRAQSRILLFVSGKWSCSCLRHETVSPVPKEFLHGPGLLTVQTRSRSCPQSLGCDVTLKLCFMLTVCRQSLITWTLSPSKHCSTPDTAFLHTNTEHPSQWPGTAGGQAQMIVCCGQLSHGIEIIKILTISC